MYIGLDLHKKREFIDSYWDKALERAKGAPLVVHILIPYPSTYQLLPRNFNRMQCIDELTLIFAPRKPPNFGNDDLLSILRDDNFPIPQCPINRFVLGIQSGRMEFNLSKLLAKWPSVSWIKILALHSKIYLDETFQFLKTTHLEIDGIPGFSSSTLNKAFPALQFLNSFDNHPSLLTKVETFETLTHLTRRQPISNIVSSYMRCPNLTTLILGTNIEEKYILDFISAHTTIRTLSIGDTFPLAEIAIVAPQLHTLLVGDSDQVHILYDWESTSLSSPPFPELQCLHIQARIPKLQLEGFEALVRSRFLSPKYPESRPIPGLQRRMRSLILNYIAFDLLIDLPRSAFLEVGMEWKKSSLLQYAKVADYHKPNVVYSTCQATLEWPDILDS